MDLLNQINDWYLDGNFLWSIPLVVVAGLLFGMLMGKLKKKNNNAGSENTGQDRDGD